MNKGLFISFEGGDGSGKSTQIRLLSRFLEDSGFDVVSVREPGGTPIGDRIRSLLLDGESGEMDPVTEAMLYAASRAQLVGEVLRPALDRGAVVICDRFVDSSIAYQGYGRGLGSMVSTINGFATGGCMPDVTFFMDIDPGCGSSRISGRDLDRIESEPGSFHERVYAGYRELAASEGSRIVTIDASLPVDQIKELVTGYVVEFIRKEQISHR